MAYEIARSIQMTKEDGLTFLSPPVFLEKGTRIKRGQIKNVRTHKIVYVTTESLPMRTGWVIESAVVPVYGQTEKASGIIIPATQEVRDNCRRFAKALDDIFKGNVPQGTRDSFMIGILLAEDLNNRKVFYAAIAGNFGFPPGWEDAAKKLGFVPAPNLSKGNEHLRNVAGKGFKPVKPGQRVRVGDLQQKHQGSGRRIEHMDWDKEGVDRRANDPGACAAQKMLQLAIKSTHSICAMWEQWYDANGGESNGIAMESCPTCKVNITRILKR